MSATKQAGRLTLAGATSDDSIVRDLCAGASATLAAALARRNRAEEEGVNYEWHEHPDGRAVCINSATEGVYLVTEQARDCLDWQYRLRGTGVPCKHQVALALRRLEAGR